jgi:hypothetical protein
MRGVHSTRTSARGLTVTQGLAGMRADLRPGMSGPPLTLIPKLVVQARFPSRFLRENQGGTTAISLGNRRDRSARCDCCHREAR